MKLAIGTVQFGLPYGINNSIGIPEDSEIKQIFNLAIESGISCLDTAKSYGNSEERIAELSGGRFEIVTKFSNAESGQQIKELFFNSLNRLKQKSIYGFMFHQANELINKPELWKSLLELRDDLKSVRKIGYSLYNVDQLNTLLSLGLTPDIVQIPYSILDRKFENSLEELNNMGVEIHVRSVFLQGLYFMNPNALPTNLEPLKNSLIALNQICEKYQKSIASIALNFAYSNPFIHQCVIGVESKSQLSENINLIENWNGIEIWNEVRNIEVVDEKLLNPINW